MHVCINKTQLSLKYIIEPTLTSYKFINWEKQIYQVTKGVYKKTFCLVFGPETVDN